MEADLFGSMSGFLKSTCVGFIDYKNPNLGYRPGLDKVTQKSAQALLWKSNSTQQGLPLVRAHSKIQNKIA